MLKIMKKVGRDMGATEAHLKYISGVDNGHKQHKEKIFTSTGIKDKRGQQLALEAWQSDLTPKKKGQRRSRRTDVRLITSWKGYKNEKTIKEYAKKFLEENFEGHKAEWACHTKFDDKGFYTQHIHFVINPRHEETGATFDIRKGDLIVMKQKHVELSKKLGLQIGYDPISRKKTRSKDKPSPRAKSQLQLDVKSKRKGKSIWMARSSKAKRLEKQKAKPRPKQ